MKKITILVLVLALSACKKSDSDSSTESPPKDSSVVVVIKPPTVPPSVTPIEPPLEEIPDVEVPPEDVSPDPVLPKNYAILSWSAPFTRMNGDSIAMGEMSHYIIAYGNNAEDLNKKIIIPDASIKANHEHKIENMDQGTWFFAVKVVDTEGLESPFSDTVSKTIN